MKISYLPIHRAARVGIGLALAQLSLGTTFAADAKPSVTATTTPKTQVLFMGADIALEKDKVFHPVEDVTATALVIKPGGKPVNVPQDQSINFRIGESLKIARTSVGIDDLKSERAFTPGADPFRQLSQSAALAAGQSASANLAQGNALRASMNTMGAAAGVEIARGSLGEGDARAALADAMGAQAAAEAGVAQAYNTPSSEIYDVGVQSAKVSEERYDAIRLSFEVTAERDVSHPYYAVIAQIRDPGSKPGHVRKWAYVKSLGSLTAGASRTVRVYQGGFTPGFVLESCEVHIYNRGEELATNLSRKRVPLTDEEALEYRVIEYIGANKGRTLRALPASTTLTGEERAALTPDQLSQTCYVRVAKDGRVAAAFRDAAGQQPLQDPALEAAMKTFRFKPALEAGKPVESIIPINLGVPPTF